MLEKLKITNSPNYSNCCSLNGTQILNLKPDKTVCTHIAGQETGIFSYFMISLISECWEMAMEQMTCFELYLFIFSSMLFRVSKNLTGSVSNQIFCFIPSNCNNLEVSINFWLQHTLTVSNSRRALTYSSDHTNTPYKYTCTHILFRIFKLRTQIQGEFLPVVKMK